MSDRDRLLVAAAALGVVFCSLIWSAAGIGLLAAQQDPSGYSSIRGDRAGDEAETQEAAWALTREACAQMSEPSDTETERHDKRDLCAQFLAASAAQNSASLANAQTIIGGVGLASVFLTLLLNAIATFAATDQAKVARRVYEELERPYLVVTVVQDHGAVRNAILTDDPKFRLPFETAAQTKFHFANIGRTPAMLVKRARHRIARWASSGPPEPLIPEISEFEELDPYGAIVTTDQPSQEFAVKGEFRPADPKLRKGPDDREIWYFVGYAIYRDLSGTHLYVTGFCHWYSANGGKWFLYQTNKIPDQYNYDRTFPAPKH